jgi:hypothetical protein
MKKMKSEMCLEELFVEKVLGEIEYLDSTTDRRGLKLIGERGVV